MASTHFSIYAPPPAIRIFDLGDHAMPRLSSKASQAAAGGSGDHLPPAPPGLDTMDARKKKHVCQTCHRGFTTSGHLSRHQRVHTGERNHACPFPGCNTRCSRQDNLQQHYRVHLSPRSRNVSTSAARQAMARRQSDIGGVINTGSITPPPMPADLGRGSPPPPASLAYRADQIRHGARSSESPPHSAAIQAAMAAPVGSLQPINTSTPAYPTYLPRQDPPASQRSGSASWPSTQFNADRARGEYSSSNNNEQPLSPISTSSSHSLSPTTHLHPDGPPRPLHPPHPNSHVRQYSTSSAGSMQDGSGSDVSAPSFMEPAFDPGAANSHYQSLPNPSYLHHSHTPSQHPSSSARAPSPSPILPPIFTNTQTTRAYNGGPYAQTSNHHYSPTGSSHTGSV